MSCSLRPNHRECVKCCDMVTSTIKCLYRFFFRLEDEEGKELVVSVTDEEVCLSGPTLHCAVPLTAVRSARFYGT